MGHCVNYSAGHFKTHQKLLQVTLQNYLLMYTKDCVFYTFYSVSINLDVHIREDSFIFEDFRAKRCFEFARSVSHGLYDRRVGALTHCKLFRNVVTCKHLY